MRDKKKEIIIENFSKWGKRNLLPKALIEKQEEVMQSMGIGASIKRIKKLIALQNKDTALWGIENQNGEYIQSELMKLHNLIEEEFRE